MMKYLNYIPKTLLQDFSGNKVVPIVGAGFSKNATIQNEHTVPDWKQLGKIISEKIPNYYYDNNAIDAVSLFEEMYTRTKLIEEIKIALHISAIYPGSTHKAFCELFTGIICTTNFDFLLEDTMKELRIPSSVIVTEESLPLVSSNSSSIIKLHGDLNHPSQMVLTEKDYDTYLDNNPLFATFVSNLFITNTLLLVGYSFDDYDFRSIFAVINKRLGKMTQPAYCFLVGASQMEISRFQRRNIKVVNFPGDPANYSTILTDIFREIKEAKNNETDKNSYSSIEMVNEQKKIPSDNNKLCFLSCPVKQLSRIKTIIDPSLVENHICIVSPEELFFSIDSNIVDGVNSCIRQSRFAIIDITQTSNYNKMEIAMIKSESKPYILISERNHSKDELNQLVGSRRILYYSIDGDSNNSFNEELSREVKEILKESDDDQFLNAKRLFEKKEYSACIVSAHSELEAIINKSCSDFRHRIFVAVFLKKHMNLNTRDTDEFLRLRNKVVHNNYEATKEDASFVLNYIEKIMPKVNKKSVEQINTD